VWRTLREQFWVDFLLAFYALIMGTIAEMIFIDFSLIHYSGEAAKSFFPPLWLIMLYPLFSITWNNSLKFFSGKLLYPLMFSCLAPLSYLAGSKIGACTFPAGFGLASAGIIPVWALLLCLLNLINDRLKEICETTYHVLPTDGLIKMLYDGDCPLCRTEVSLLKKSPGKDRISFVDIARPDYQAAHHQQIDYPTAMQQMTAIDTHEKIITGIDSFVLIYHQAGWNGLAIILQAPGLYALAKLLYRLFAANRLLLTGRSCPKDKNV
jgi:predicted DCC family thiol-disulfide oxidoreductase YuxK